LFVLVFVSLVCPYIVVLVSLLLFVFVVAVSFYFCFRFCFVFDFVLVSLFFGYCFLFGANMLIRSTVFSDAVVHGFSTGELDLSPASPDWAHFPSLFGEGYEAALVSQVHGDVAIFTQEGGIRGKADALITDKPGLVVSIRTADCVPILVECAGMVAAIHAGWRGIANGIVGKTIQALKEPLAAAVGPCISVANYEVGFEVVDGIVQAGVPRECFVEERKPRPHVDLKKAAAFQLRAAGIKNIEVLPHCTFGDKGFHSYRRDGNRSGRLAAMIGLRL